MWSPSIEVCHIFCRINLETDKLVKSITNFINKYFIWSCFDLGCTVAISTGWIVIVRWILTIDYVNMVEYFPYLILCVVRIYLIFPSGQTDLTNIYLNHIWYGYSGYLVIIWILGTEYISFEYGYLISFVFLFGPQFAVHLTLPLC